MRALWNSPRRPVTILILSTAVKVALARHGIDWPEIGDGTAPIAPDHPFGTAWELCRALDYRVLARDLIKARTRGRARRA